MIYEARRMAMNRSDDAINRSRRNVIAAPSQSFAYGKFFLEKEKTQYKSLV